MRDAAGVNLPAIFIANGLGAWLMVLILANKKRYIKTASFDERLFYGMCLSELFLCITETAAFLLDGQTFAGARQLAVLVNTVLFIISILFTYAWVCYVDYKLFEDMDRLKKRYRAAAIPAAIVVILSVANLFTGVFFTIGPENIYERAPLFPLTYLAAYGYLIYGAQLAFRYREKVKRQLHIPVLTFFLPVLVGGLVQMFCYGLATIWVSVAINIVSLYISLQNEGMYLDPLTGLYNRNYVRHCMQQYAFLRRSKKTPWAGIMLDVDNFKQINDTYGHLEGDAALCTIGDILRQAAGGWVAARYGGDEFVILLPASQTELVRDRIDRELAEYSRRAGARYRLSVSMGVARFEGTSIDVDHFFREMDQKMYEEKQRYLVVTSGEKQTQSRRMGVSGNEKTEDSSLTEYCAEHYYTNSDSSSAGLHHPAGADQALSECPEYGHGPGGELCGGRGADRTDGLQEH